jgi:hypothetical protein
MCKIFSLALMYHEISTSSHQLFGDVAPKGVPSAPPHGRLEGCPVVQACYQIESHANNKQQQIKGIAVIHLHHDVRKIQNEINKMTSLPPL